MALALYGFLAFAVIAVCAFAWLPPVGAAVFCALAGGLLWWEWRDLSGRRL